jgi:hypothetical protein
MLRGLLAFSLATVGGAVGWYVAYIVCVKLCVDGQDRL